METTSHLAIPLVRVPQLRIVVNSRCQRFCFYCRPSGEGVSTAPSAQLNSAFVIRVARAFAELGGTEIKLTGGDPALWDPLVETVTQVKLIPGIKSVHVISRHPKLGELAPALAVAGADLLNMSIDTLKPKVHQLITGVNDLPLVLEAMRKCVASGIPCKANSVILKGVNDKEVDDLINFCEQTGIQSIKLLDVIHDLHDGTESYKNRLKIFGHSLRDLYVPLTPYIELLRARAVSATTQSQGNLGHPMTVLTLPSGFEVVVKDYTTGAWYGSICNACEHYPCHDALMALRLTADGQFQPCLLNETATQTFKDAGSFEDYEALQHLLHSMLSVYTSASFQSVSEIP
jgi:cyclic pyranopterin phosphate synthase